MPRSEQVGRWTIFAQVERSRGTGPRATVKKSVLLTVGRGPVPRRASIGTRNGLDRRAFFARVVRSRGTGPRATVCKAVSFHRRARAWPSPCLGGGNGWLACVFRAGQRSRGTGPRATVCKAVSLHRRARACPSPCLGWGNGVGWRAFSARVERSRGTGPRATVDERACAPFGIRRSRTTVSCS